MVGCVMNNADLVLLQHHNQLVNAIASTESISRGVRTLLVAVATFFNMNEQCAYPNRQQLSKRTGYHPNHITVLIKEAVELGFLTSTAQFFLVDGESAPRQVSNKYEFALETFGLFFNKAKLLLNRNLRKKKKKEQELEASRQARREFSDEQVSEALKDSDLNNVDDWLPPPLE